MMSHQQTENLKEFLRAERFTDEKLIDDLVDHFSCEIESILANENVTFEHAFELAKQKILPNEPLQVQKDLEFLTTKTQNIMIKKIAFIGGYVSALCLCLSILFFSQSFISSEKITLQSYAMEIESYQLNMNGSNKERGKELSDQLSTLTNQNMLDRAQKFENAELLLIISVLTFGLTYLPYRFYSGFKQSELQLQS